MRLGSWRRGGVTVGTIFFVYFLFCQFFLLTHAMNGIARSLSGLVLIPAAVVDGRIVSYRQIVELAHGLRGFSQITNDASAFDKALQLSVYREYIKALAQAHQVAIVNDEVAAYPLDETVLAAGLLTSDWTEADYRQYIVEPLLLAQKTALAVESDDWYQGEALATMESLRKKLTQGMPFADVAENFSQDPSALSRGDLGIMSLATMPTWLTSAADLEPGQMSEVLSARDTYWTVTMVEFFPSEIPEQAAAHFRGIAVKKKSFGAIVGDLMATDNPWVFVW